MSRELKFRVWDKEQHRFDTPNVHHLEKNCSTLHIKLNHDIVKVCGDDRFIIQQFIGLLDKNGKEIYEGDIVNFKEYNEIDDFTIDVNLVCIYSHYNAWFSFVVDVENEHDEGYYWMEIKDKCEVVGNIFEKL